MGSTSRRLTTKMHNLPQLTTTYHNLPQLTTTYHNLPQLTTTYHNLPQLTTTYHNLPQLTTTYHNLPQLTTIYHQKVPIARYVRRIDTQIAVRVCAICSICSIYIMPKVLGDILTVSIFIGGCVFSFTKLVCAAILRQYINIYPHCTAAMQNGGTCKLGE